MNIDKLSGVDKFTNCRHSDDFQVSLSMLSLNAKRILYLVMAQMYNAKTPEQPELTFVIAARDYAEICSISDKTSYRSLYLAVTELQQSVIYENLKEVRATDGINITRRVRYHHDEGYCTITLNSDVYPYFFELSKGFTTNNLYEVARLSESMASNLYQVIMKRYSKKDANHKYETYFEIPIEDLKDELGLFVVKGKKKEYKYEELRELKRLLKKNIAVIQKETSFPYVLFTDGRKVSRTVKTLKFYYYNQSLIDAVSKKEENKILNSELDEIEKNLYGK